MGLLRHGCIACVIRLLLAHCYGGIALELILKRACSSYRPFWDTWTPRPRRFISQPLTHCFRKPIFVLRSLPSLFFRRAPDDNDFRSDSTFLFRRPSEAPEGATANIHSELSRHCAAG